MNESAINNGSASYRITINGTRGWFGFDLSVMRAEVQQVTFDEANECIVRTAYLRSALSDCIYHRLDVRRRTGNDA
jgi:hypothetical protein